MPHDSYLHHVAADAGLELQRWEYTKAANKAALDLITGRPGEIYTTTDDGVDWQWNAIADAWNPLSVRTTTDLYDHTVLTHIRDAVVLLNNGVDPVTPFWSDGTEWYTRPNPVAQNRDGPTITLPSGSAVPTPTNAGDTLWIQPGAGVTDQFFQTVTTAVGALTWQSSPTLPQSFGQTAFSSLPAVVTYGQWLALSATNLWMAADLTDGTVSSWAPRLGGVSLNAAGLPTKYSTGQNYNDQTATLRTADRDLVFLEGPASGQFFTGDGLVPSLQATDSATFLVGLTMWGSGSANFGRIYSAVEGVANPPGVQMFGNSNAPWTSMTLRVGDGATLVTAANVAQGFDSHQVAGWTVTPTTLQGIGSSLLGSSIARTGNDETPVSTTTTVIGANQATTANFLAGAVSWIMLLDKSVTQAEITAISAGVATL